MIIIDMKNATMTNLIERRGGILKRVEENIPDKYPNASPIVSDLKNTHAITVSVNVKMIAMNSRSSTPF